MPDRQRQTNLLTFRGLNTVLVADALPAGKSPCAVNVRAVGDSGVRTRPGFDLSFSTGGLPATDLRAYATLLTDNAPRIIVHDSGGGVWLDDGVKKGQVGTGGTGASLIPYRPNQSPQSWMYVCNRTGYEKFSAPAASVVVQQKVGIKEPQTAPEACPDGFSYNEFTSIAAAWPQGGTAAAPSDATRSTDTAVAIFLDPASVSPATRLRYSVQIGTTIQYQVGETVTFNLSGGGTNSTEVEDVYPPINAGVALTIQSIYYFNGPTGNCVLVPSQMPFGADHIFTDSGGTPSGTVAALANNLASLRRGSLIKLNAEVVLVLSVSVGPQHQIAIECSTASTHVAGETIIGIPAICVSGINSQVVGQTVAAAQINSAITTGIGTLTQTFGTNPFNLSLGGVGTPQEDDLVHVSLKVDVLANIVEMKLLFDVGDGSFTQNIAYYTVNLNALQSALLNNQTQLNAVLQAEQQSIINQVANQYPGVPIVWQNGHAYRQQSLPGQGGTILIPLTNTPVISVQSTTGASQWTEVIFPISDLVRSGNDQTKTLANCTKAQLLVNCAGNVAFSFGSIWIGGGGQLNVGDQGAPYRYRARPRSALTGATGNPSQATRYGITPRDQRGIISLPSATYDTQIDTWDIFRYGGTVTSWRRVGSAKSTATTWVDNTVDSAALAGELLDFDNFEPWPSVDVPFTGTVGDGNITNVTVYGTAVKVLGTTFPTTIAKWLPGTLITLDGQLTYTLWSRPISILGGYLFRIIESAGAPTVTTLFVNEPNVANQIVPYLWGPDANGVIFGVGDPLRPGFLYSAKQFAPDMSPNNAYDVCAPSEPLMGGEVVDGLALVASSKRWWMIQQAFGTAKRWQLVETPAGRGLAAPLGHCTDGKRVYFWAKDGIMAMIPGVPAQSLTDMDLQNLFPNDGVTGQNVTYGPYTFYAPEYKYAALFRLTVVNSILRVHYRDTSGFARTLVLDMSDDSTGKPRMAWSLEVYPETMQILNSYQPEQPPGTLTVFSGTAYPQCYMVDHLGRCYLEEDFANDNGEPIAAAFATPEWNATDARVGKQWIDAMVDAIPQSAITVAPYSKRVAVGTPSAIAAGATRALTLTPLGNPIANFLALLMSWTDDFDSISLPTTVYEWSSEFVAQPLLIRSWKSVPTSHGLKGYHHIRDLFFAYLASAPVTLTITAYDGNSPAVLTLPSTSGLYNKVEFVPTFNKGLMFTYEATSDEPWAPIEEDCEVHVGAWARSGEYSVFTGLGGRENV